MSGQHLRRRHRAGRRMLRWLLGALVVGILAGAAGITVHDEWDGSNGVVTATEPTQTTVTTGVVVATPARGPITLAFVGDINVERSLATRLDEQPDDFVGPFASVLRDADLVVANLEAALTSAGTPQDKDYVFRAPPAVLDALAAGGIDVVSVANNHGMDYGPDGFAETLAIRASHPAVAVIGAGTDEDDAYGAFVREIGGYRVAVIAATQVISAELIATWTATAEQPGLASAKRVDRLVDEVEAASADADVVVVFLHWGVETEQCPSSAQEELASALVAAGADVVVGAHAHRVQAAGMSGSAVVDYGLGNFLFGAVSPESAESGVLLVTVDDGGIGGYEWVPGRIVDRVPQPLVGDDAAAALASWNERRGCTDLTP